MEVGSAEHATSLFIKPLRHRRSLHRPQNICERGGGGEHDNSIGHYEVLSRKVSPSPLQKRSQFSGTATSAEIETRLEQFVHKNDGSILWRRVVVSSGPCSIAGVPSSNNDTIHASFILPEDDATKGVSAPSGFYLNPDLVCWTSFSDRPDHDVLCVLAHPSLLCIWDVYPTSVKTSDDMSRRFNDDSSSTANPSRQSTASSEQGFHVSLPFEACGIHGIAYAKEGRGLLLQRFETVEDCFIHQERTRENNGKPDSLRTESQNDDGFVLQPPPKPVRLGGKESENCQSKNPVLSRGGNESSGGVAGLPSAPSLFSLLHPRGDVLPVTLSERITKNDQIQEECVPNLEYKGPVTDVFEKILFVGTVEWSDAAAQSPHSKTIYVTYHTQLKR